MEENENANANIICTLEDREIIEQMKQAKIEKLREIETLKKKSDAIDAGCEIAKGVVTVAGALLTVVMTVCPLDGPAGEVATILGSAALIKAIDSSKNLLKATFVNKNVEEISSALIDISGKIKEIKVKDADLVQNVETENKEKEEVPNLNL